jgi:uncharacterized protein YbjT (DUF2867 family)
MIYLSSMQRPPVTGGAGFIGAHVTAALLRAGLRVRSLDKLAMQIHGGVPRGLDWLSAAETELPRGSATSDGDLRAALDSADAIINVGSALFTSAADIARQLGAAFSASPRLVTGQYQAANAELSAWGMLGVGSVS